MSVLISFPPKSYYYRSFKRWSIADRDRSHRRLKYRAHRNRSWQVHIQNPRKV